MMYAGIKKEHLESHVIEELRRLGETNIHGKSYEELVHRLSVLRAMEVDVEAPSNKWFN